MHRGVIAIFLFVTACWLGGAAALRPDPAAAQSSARFTVRMHVPLKCVVTSISDLQADVDARRVSLNVRRFCNARHEMTFRLIGPGGQSRGQVTFDGNTRRATGNAARFQFRGGADRQSRVEFVGVDPREIQTVLVEIEAI